MNQKNEIIQDEMSIRELIETIWKGKVIIAIVTMIAILASAIVGFFILPEKYEATVSLSVKPITINISPLDSTVSIVDYLAFMPVKTKADYLQQVTSSQVLENTIEKLGLKDASGNKLSASALSNMITVTDIVSTDRIAVAVNSTNPQQAAFIANTLSQEFDQIVADDCNAQIKEVSNAIAKQLSDEETVLSDKTKALNDYRSENVNIDVLKKDVDELIGQISQYHADLQDLQTQITSDTAALQVLESISQSTDIVTSGDYNLSIGVSNDTSGQTNVIVPPDSLQDSLLTININRIQTRLITNLSQKETLDARIPEMESTLTDLQTTLTDQEYKYNVVNNDMETAQLEYEAYQQRSRVTLTYSSSDIGKSIISISSEASIPGAPVSPNKMKNIAIAGMMGFCLSVFFVLFRNYWRRTKVVSPK